jgi:hypothetical protein
MSTGVIAIDDQWSLWRRFAVRSPGLPVEFVDAFAVPEILTGAPVAGLDDRSRAVAAEATWSALADDTFMAALIWQNPSVVETWAGRLADAARTGERGEYRRRNERERVIARYAQRYAMKNESIGFFGPVAWGVFGDSVTPLDRRGGLGVRTGSISFEVWAIHELAARWSRRPDVRPYTPVRLHPAATVRGGRMVRPRGRPLPLDDITSALIAALGEGAPLGATVVAAARAGGLDTEVVAKIAEELDDAGWLRIGFRVPFDARPERHLRTQVAEITNDIVRADLTGYLDRLDAARSAVAGTMRDPVRLPNTMSDLDQAFAEAGGLSRRPLVRNGMGRTAIYADCRRDLDVQVGPELVDALREPLALLLRSADWITAEVAGIVERNLATEYARLRRRHEVVTLADLQAAVTEILLPGNRAVEEVAEDFRLRWSEVLPSSGSRVQQLHCAAVRPLVEALFPRRGLAWAAARHHTPDLMIRRDGDGWHWVLGELHVALNTLESRLFVTQCEDRAELIESTAADFRGGRVVPLYPPDGVASNSRTYPPPALDPPGAFRYWSYADDRGHEDGYGSVPVTMVRVTEEAGRLIGEAGEWRAPVIEFLGEFLTALCVDMFRLRASAPHAPRVLLGDLVVCRETWRFAASEIPLPRRRPDDYTYGRLRAWAQANGMPRHVFVQAPHEPKPVYVDFAAPALLDNMARMVRVAADAGAAVTITEMLPGPDELWLTDPDGLRYTAELRVVATRTGATDTAVQEA